MTSLLSKLIRALFLAALIAGACLAAGLQAQTIGTSDVQGSDWLCGDAECYTSSGVNADLCLCGVCAVAPDLGQQDHR